MISSNSLPSKAGAKVQTFFHSTKLFLKKNCNMLIYSAKFIPSYSPSPLYLHILKVMIPRFFAFFCPLPPRYSLQMLKIRKVRCSCDGFKEEISLF